VGTAGAPANLLNQIPRNGGDFYWRQAWNAVTENPVWGGIFVVLRT